MNPYDFAIQMSRDGEKFFRTLTKQVKKPGLRRIVVMLASDQTIHRMLRTANPDLAARLRRQTEEDVKRRWEFLRHVAARSFRPSGETPS